MDYSSTKTQEEMIETKIVDDFLSEYHCNSIENALLGTEPSKNQYGQFETGASAMPWYYTSNLNGQPKLGNYMFSCWFIKDFESTSPGEYYLPLFIPILTSFVHPCFFHPLYFSILFFQEYLVSLASS